MSTWNMGYSNSFCDVQVSKWIHERQRQQHSHKNLSRELCKTLKEDDRWEAQMIS